jgi:hypothetical protein
VDQNGKLQWLDGKELEDAWGSTFFENEVWLAADQGGADVKRVGQESEGRTKLDVLEVTPGAGRPRRFYFDSSTGLLVKSTLKQQDRTVVSHYSGYERMAGRLRARDSRIQVEGMPANDAAAHVDSVFVGLAMDSLTFLPPGEKAKDFRFLGEARAARIPMRYGERHVWVKASVNGAPPEEFLLDTGASITVVDSAWAAKYGLVLQGEMEGGGAGATGKVRFSELQSLRVAGPDGQGVEMAGQRIAVLPLNVYIAPYMWREAAGILGYDFISRFVLTVDYENGVLVIEDPEGFEYHGQGQPVPMGLAGNIPVVRAKVDGMEDDFRLDVGSGGSVDLHAPFAAKNGFAQKVEKTVSTVGGGFGGTFPLLACRFKTFEIGPFTVKDPLGSLSQATRGALASEDYAGNIGNRILERFACTFDYSRKTLYLAPNAKLGQRDEYDRFGAQVARRDGRFEVANVTAGSPAEAAQLRVGDEVRSVAGKPIAGYTQDDLQAAFAGAREGSSVPVEIVRDGKTRKVKVKVKSVL